MAHRQKDPLRPLSERERARLEHISRSGASPASHVERAKVLLAVGRGEPYMEAARGTGRRSGEGVAKLVARFNREGLSAIETKHGGGSARLYNEAEKDRILREVGRKPDRDLDGTANWSVATLQQALRRAPDGLPRVSTHTVWKVLREAGYSWQKDRSWCETGQAERKRTAGIVRVHDPDATPKKTDRGGIQPASDPILEHR